MNSPAAGAGTATSAGAGAPGVATVGGFTGVDAGTEEGAPVSDAAGAGVAVAGAKKS